MNQNESQQNPDEPTYPSQNPDFLSFNVASTPLPKRNVNDRKSNDYFYNRGSRTPYNNLSGGKYRNQYQQNNSYFQNRSGSDNQFRQRKFNNFQQNDNADFSNNPNRYSGRSSFGRYNNQNNFRHRGGGNQSQKNRSVDISQYFHSTMLEDPWKELVERHIALSQSLTDNLDDENLDGFLIEKSSESSSDEEDKQ